MKRNIVTRTISGAVSLAMMLGITVAAAQAQYRDNDHRRNNTHDDSRDRDWRGGRGDDDRRGNWGHVNINAIAQQNGYRDGIRHGERDRQRRMGFNFAHSSQYRHALSGYRFGYGNRDRYRDAYRQGYRRGYIEGFRRGNNRWPF